MTGHRPNENLWGVPAAVLVVSLAGTLVAWAGAVYSTGGTYDYTTSLDPRLALGIVATPAAAAVTAAVAFFSIGPLGRRGPLLGPVAGGLGGLATTAALGTQYAALTSWWLAAVPDDTNRAAALIAAWIVAFASVAVVLCTFALFNLGARDYRRRNRILGLAILAAVVGGLVGMFAGGLTAAVDSASQGLSFANVAGDADGGVLDGLFIGSIVGLIVGFLTATAAVLAYPPSTPSTATPSPTVP